MLLMADGLNQMRARIYICVAYGTTTSDLEWNILCDIGNPFGIINIIDVVTVTANYE